MGSAGLFCRADVGAVRDDACTACPMNSHVSLFVVLL